MKRFKYCDGKQMERAIENYKNGGKSNLIYVHILENGETETVEVFDCDMHLSIFDDEEAMKQFFIETGEPKVKDLINEQIAIF